MLLISSASNPELHLVLGYSNSGDVMLISFYFILSFSKFCISFMFFLIILYFTPKLFTLFSIWFFIIDISYTIHLLINSFLILDKHSVDLILVHSLLVSLQICCFCMESLFQLFFHLFLFVFSLYYTSF